MSELKAIADLISAAFILEGLKKLYYSIEGYSPPTLSYMCGNYTSILEANTLCTSINSFFNTVDTKCADYDSFCAIKSIKTYLGDTTVNLNLKTLSYCDTSTYNSQTTTLLNGCSIDDNKLSCNALDALWDAIVVQEDCHNHECGTTNVQKYLSIDNANCFTIQQKQLVNFVSTVLAGNITASGSTTYIATNSDSPMYNDGTIFEIDGPTCLQSCIYNPDYTCTFQSCY